MKAVNQTVREQPRMDQTVKEHPRMANIAKRKPFVKGDPRINRKGKKPTVDLMQAIRDALSQPNALERIAEALRQRAAKGDIKAIELLLDRLHGKVSQGIAIESQPVINVEHNVILTSREQLEQLETEPTVVRTLQPEQS